MPIANHCPKCAAPLPDDAPQGLCPKCLLLAAATPTETSLGPATSANAPSLESVRAAFPQLEVLELIGAGGMGAVYKARQPKLDRLVALKVLSPSLAASPAFAERFNREARVLARLNHPGIVNVFDFGTVDQAASPLQAQDHTGGPPVPLYFLLMEFVDGVNLRQAMQAGRFTAAQALALVPKICEALQFAHEEGILHRDIKPENILLDTKGRVKIADFGIAKLVGEPLPVTKLTATGAAIGTPQYMAPEQLEHPEDVDQRADIYSLGVVFYEMLTGELPLGRFAPPSEKSPVDPRVDEVVFRTLEREREKRYHSAGEVKTQVEGIRGTPTLPPATGPRATAREAAPAGTPALGQGASAAGIAGPRWSWKSVGGAALVAMSFVLVLAITMVVVSLGGGLGMIPTALMVGCILLFLGLPGTILGWMGLVELRASAGRLHGLPFAVFAALAWPLGLLLGVTVVAPMFVGITVTAEEPPPLWTRFILVVPAGALTFAVWAVYATARWGGNHLPSARRGILKWIFLSLLLALVLPLAIIMLAPSRHLPNRATPRRLGAVTSGIGAQFTVPAGQVAVFEIVTRSNRLVVPLPNLGAYVIAAPGEPVAGTFQFTRNAEDRSTGKLRHTWQIALETAGGSAVSGGLDLPEELEVAVGAMNLALTLAPDQEAVCWGGAEDGNTQPDGAVGLRVRTQAHNLPSGPLGKGGSSGTGTNWLQVSTSATSPGVVFPVTSLPKENFVLTAVMLSNGVPVTGRELRAKLPPLSGREPSRYRVRWQATAGSGNTSVGASWEVVVEEEHSGIIAARLRPTNAPPLAWRIAPGAEKPSARSASHALQVFEVAQALQTSGGGNAGVADWSVRLQLQSAPEQRVGSRGIDADFVLPAHQAAVFELVVKSNGVIRPFPELAAYVANASGKPYEGKFLLADDPDDLDSLTALPRWKFGITGPTGRSLMEGLAVPPVPLDWAGELKLWTTLKPDAETLHGQVDSTGPGPAYGLRIRTANCRAPAGQNIQAMGQGTNWVEAVSAQVAPPAR